MDVLVQTTTCDALTGCKLIIYSNSMPVSQSVCLSAYQHVCRTV